MVLSLKKEKKKSSWIIFIDRTIFFTLDKLKSRIEKYRIARQLHEGTDLSSSRENEKEEELKKEMKIERAK